jgi:hypothetical protein
LWSVDREALTYAIHPSGVLTTKPEAAYFLAKKGQRGGMLFFDLKEPSDIPRIAEVLFQGADAALEFVPVMNADDLKKALSSL